MIPQELKIIRMFESGKSPKEILATYNIGSSTVSDVKGWKYQLVSYMASAENVN
jgi:DNA-binding CsgD family transcriptional regulator